jgi:hypothetical protein
MRRRAFVVRTAAALAAGTWPGWLRRAFASDSDCPPGTADLPSARRWLEIFSAAYRRAQAAGKPLLVLVVPDAEDERWTRGRAFGELLNHGGNEIMASLALAEVTCAPMSAVKAFLPSLRDGEPLMVLVETGAVPGRAALLDATLPQEEERWRTGDVSYEERLARANAVVERRIAVVGKLLRDALAPDLETVERRARQQVAQLLPPQLLAVGPELAAANPDAAKLDAWAAIAYLAALEGPSAASGRLLAALAAGARRRLTGGRVPGSRWAQSSGCGTDIEWEPGEKDDSSVGIACGMGHVPEKSRRFLDFLTADGSWPKNIW